jgi:hypothetical protein
MACLAPDERNLTLFMLQVSPEAPSKILKMLLAISRSAATWGRQEKEHITGVQGCMMRDTPDTQMMEKRPLLGFAKQCVQNIHDEDEKDGG